MNSLKDLAKILLIISLIFVGADSIYGQRQSRIDYIKKYKDTAIRQMKSHGIPASIILAQACLESGDGNSRLAVKGNNHFGIKCHKWQGKRIYEDDDSRGECFRKYDSADESFRDHSDFLRYKDRYKPLFDLSPKDYKSWAYGLKKAGYATHPQYPQMLIKIIEEYQLYNYDGEYRGELPPSPTELEAIKEYKPIETSELYKFSLARTLYQKNGVAYLIASSGDTYRALAEEFQLFTRELLRFNDLRREQPINEETIVYIEPKKSEGEKNLEKHVVEKDDTMYKISQRYAVRLKYLYKMNNMKEGTEPDEGDIIRLR